MANDNFENKNHSELLAVIGKMHDELKNAHEKLKNLENRYDSLQLDNQFLKEEVRILRHRLFGARSEKWCPPVGSSVLFNDVEKEAAEPPKEEPSTPVEGHSRKKPCRKPLPEEMPRVEIVHDLPEAEKTCPADGTELKLIGEDVSEQLDIIPATIQVLRHRRLKYACPCCSQHVATAPLPPQPLPKSMASAGLLANITVAKYQNALPLYRQETIFQEIGVDLPRQTMARWMVECSELVSPLVERMKETLLGSSVLHCDETVVQVLKEKGRAPQTNSYMWVLASGADIPPCYYFEYHPSRSKEAANALLNGFQGYLHVDGYLGYNALCSTGAVTRVGCFAHARRKFDETLKAGSSNGTGIASKALEKISELYEIERAIKESPPDERNRIRQERSKPLLSCLHEWATSVLPSVPPKSKLGMALRYLLDEWPNLIRYVDHPGLSIDNNRAENAIRPFVTGRKNWLFSATPAGATASSRLYSLVTSAQANGHIPYLYLRDVYQEMAKLREKGSKEDLDRLLPWNWKVTSED